MDLESVIKAINLEIEKARSRERRGFANSSRENARGTVVGLKMAKTILREELGCDMHGKCKEEKC